MGELFEVSAVPLRTMQWFRVGYGDHAEQHAQKLLDQARADAKAVGFRAASHLEGGARSIVLRGTMSDGADVVMKTAPAEFVRGEIAGYRYLSPKHLPDIRVVGTSMIVTAYIEADNSATGQAVEIVDIERVAQENEKASARALVRDAENGLERPSLSTYIDVLKDKVRMTRERISQLTTSEQWDVEIAEDIIEELAKRPAPQSIAHGDFLRKNIIRSHDGKVYAIDPSPVYGDANFDLAFYLSEDVAESTRYEWSQVSNKELDLLLFVLLALDRPFAAHSKIERDGLLRELKPLADEFLAWT